MSQNYNINMKKFNGTDYDGLLPLAYNALNSQQLDGKTFNEIQNLFTKIYSGSYYGTGTYGTSNYISLSFSFAPIFLYNPIAINQDSLGLSNLIPTKDITTSPKKITINTQSVYIYFKDDNKTEIRIYSTSSAANQFNVSSTLYYYLGLRDYDFGNGKPVEPPLTQTEWLYKYSDGASGIFTVPRSGYYYIELYGGGGAACGTNGVYASGGASCQSYDSIYFSISEKIPFTIGAGGISNNASGTGFYRRQGGTTAFGTYSVTGATGGAGYFDNQASSPTLGQVIITSTGNGSGNLGKNGTKTNGSTNTVGSGKYSSVCGASGTGGNGVAGGVYIKYLRD